MWNRIGNAEQAKGTGGMIALFPRQDDAMNLAIPGGEPPEDMHVTLLYSGESDPCMVYLVGDGAVIADLQYDLTARLQHSHDLSKQHKPYVPHITAGYGLPFEALSYTGPIHFDRLALKWAGQSMDFPLL
jgi:hypothetical protein